MRIGIRTIKTAIGSGLAIFIAQLLGLQFYGSAGILTILCIEKTKVKSLQTAFNRTMACLLGLVVGGILFEVFGYHPFTFTLFILIILPILVKLGIQSGFITSIVIILHLYSLQKISIPIVINELLLIVVGIGMALIFNSFMPSLERNLISYQKRIEVSFKKILYEFAVYLEKGDQGWDGKEIVELEDLLYEAKSVAIQKVENQLLRRNDQHYRYFEMREKQFEILERMLPTISTLDENVLQRKILSEFFYYLSEQVKEENTAEKQLNQLDQIREDMRKLPLPQSREEFETRASLFYLMNEIELYLQIKRETAI